MTTRTQRIEVITRGEVSRLSANFARVDGKRIGTNVSWVELRDELGCEGSRGDSAVSSAVTGRLLPAGVA